MQASQLFTQLNQYYHKQPNRRQEVHIDCPFCGANNKGHSRVSYYDRGEGDRGFKCFVCGRGVGLYALAAYVGLTTKTTSPPPAPVISIPPPSPKPYWREWSKQEYRRRFTGDFNVVRQPWGKYKRLNDQTLQRYDLGWGVLPLSRCRHYRLVVPIFSGDELVCLRGRALDCHCTKWLASDGWKLNRLTLYNSDRILPGQVVLVVENPIDAIMIGLPEYQESIYKLIGSQLSVEAARSILRLAELGQMPFTGVATLSVSYWQDSWAEPLKQASQVIVAYDNDLPGNGGAARREELIKDWEETHDNQPPPAAGCRLTNRLLDDSIYAILFDWKNAVKKQDIGGYLT